ncbi:uncharacterized protein LOC118885337 [Balaenoptera musculus]|uniref:Uncharacterized protein LOC118885337 n=1 Tax=Balaenoptera musculus TaxID=9771 RepID=A0A8B8VYJ7_BALMU|nr:uncharacterized protein LOC118885337 [Balaenoptera musculus]
MPHRRRGKDVGFGVGLALLQDARVLSGCWARNRGPGRWGRSRVRALGAEPGPGLWGRSRVRALGAEPGPGSGGGAGFGRWGRSRAPGSGGGAGFGRWGRSRARAQEAEPGPGALGPFGSGPTKNSPDTHAHGWACWSLRPSVGHSVHVPLLPRLAYLLSGGVCRGCHLLKKRMCHPYLLLEFLPRQRLHSVMLQGQRTTLPEKVSAFHPLPDSLIALSAMLRWL